MLARKRREHSTAEQRDQAKPLDGLGCWLMREMERDMERDAACLGPWGVAFCVRRRKGVIAHSQPG